MFKVNENKSTWSLDGRPSNQKILNNLILKFNSSNTYFFLHYS